MKRIYVALAGLAIVTAPAALWAANADSWHGHRNHAQARCDDEDRGGGANDRHESRWNRDGDDDNDRGDDGDRGGRGGRYDRDRDDHRGGERRHGWHGQGGGLTPEEMQAVIAVRFKHIDTNGDGAVSLDEMQAAATERMKARDGARAPRGEDEQPGAPATPPAPPTPPAPMTPPAPGAPPAPPAVPTPLPSTPATPQ